jgi:hypothetical protein
MARTRECVLFASVASSLSRWLASLPADRLASVLARRPETLGPPAPYDLAEVAHRLQAQAGQEMALVALPLPAVQLIEAAAAFKPADREALAALVHRTPAELAGALRLMEDSALAWEWDGRLHLAAGLRDPRPRVSGGHPLGLGPRVDAVLDRQDAQTLEDLAEALGVAVRGGPARPPVRRLSNGRAAASRLASGGAAPRARAGGTGTLRALRDFYHDADQVRALVAGAPAATARLLDRVARREPVLELDSVAGDGLDWALERGLLVTDGWQYVAMPFEIGLALRGSDWHPPFDPEPPAPPLTTVDIQDADREGGAAAASTVEGVAALLALAELTPVTLRKAGGVGPREQRRLAKAIGTDEATVRLWLEVSYTAGLLASMGDELVPTEGYDEWLAQPPADRLVPLLGGWWLAPAVPGRPDAVPLLRDLTGHTGGLLRQRLVQLATDLPAAAVADPADLVPLLHWQAPLLPGTVAEAEEFVRPLWNEATSLGVIAHGTATTLARALVGNDPDALSEAARRLLPAAVPEAIFQADLTAVVPGIPTGTLASLLDSAADRESRGTASTWRFSEVSIRRALDAGHDTGQLAAALRTSAVGGALPQPLEYLLRDVARGYGRLRVREVGCVLHAEDPALLAEVLATRALVPLRLRRLAPTVLASASDPEQTLAALRAAGYAPVGEDAAGEPVLRRVEPRRAAKRRQTLSYRTLAPPREPAEPGALAAALLSPEPKKRGAKAAKGGAKAAKPPRQAPVPDPEPELDLDWDFEPEPPDTLTVVTRCADLLNPFEQRLLAHAIDESHPVEIGYLDASGRHTTRVIEGMMLDGKGIAAWCRLRDDERMFLLDRIDSVAPA